jgi:homoserine dehydrogenase
MAACCATSPEARRATKAARLSASSSFAARASVANINLTDNIVQFVTDRYRSNPLVVQGPGAGPAVTASGVFADLLRLAAYLGDGTSV